MGKKAPRCGDDITAQIAGDILAGKTQKEAVIRAGYSPNNSTTNVLRYTGAKDLIDELTRERAAKVRTRLEDIALLNTVPTQSELMTMDKETFQRWTKITELGIKAARDVVLKPAQIRATLTQSYTDNDLASIEERIASLNGQLNDTMIDGPGGEKGKLSTEHPASVDIGTGKAGETVIMTAEELSGNDLPNCEGGAHNEAFPAGEGIRAGLQAGERTTAL